MDGVNKTLYIPLYGKAMISRRGIILHDKKAEEIWMKEQFSIQGKAKSKWLALYMAMRARVFDDWTAACITKYPNALVIHIGCGMDSRAFRIGYMGDLWFDVDFPQVIDERRKYYDEDKVYHMLSADARESDWIDNLPDSKAVIVILEGISMYLENSDVIKLFDKLGERFDTVRILIDVYTVLGARASKYKNPINTVGVTKVNGVDSPEIFSKRTIKYIGEHNMTPKALVNELHGIEKRIFKTMFAGKFSKAMYRLYEYGTES